MLSRDSLARLFRPPARTLVALVCAWVLFAACAMELYAWRYEVSSSDIVVRLAVLAAAAGGFLLFRRRRDRGPSARRVEAVAAIVITALAVRLFAVNLLHAMLVLGLLTAGLVGAWALARSPGPRWLRRALVALLLATLHFLLLGYYVLLFVGREAWQAVISRELIVAYLPHVHELVRILQISPWIPYGSVALVYLAFLAAYLACSGRICESLGRSDEGAPTRAALPARVAATGVLAGVVCAR